MLLCDHVGSRLASFLVFLVVLLSLEACGDRRTNQKRIGAGHEASTSVGEISDRGENVPSKQSLSILRDSDKEVQRQPATIFAVRSSTIGAVEPLRPEFIRFGRARMVEYQGWDLGRSNGETVRKKLRYAAGVRLFDEKKRVVGNGIWSDGSILISRFEYDEKGGISRSTTARDGVTKKNGIAYEYERLDDSFKISGIQEKTGETVQTEYQFFNNEDRMTKDLVLGIHGGVQYNYGYDAAGKVTIIVRYDLGTSSDDPSEIEPSEKFLFEYNYKGLPSKFTRLGLSAKGLTGSPISYEYDENGNIVREIYGEGPDAGVVEYTYEFDDHGNWIRQTGWPVSDDPNVSGYEIERTISYYE